LWREQLEERLAPVVEEEVSRALPVSPEEEEALPEWAKDLRPAMEAPTPPEEEAAPAPFLEGVDLPEWLQAEERPAVEGAPAEAPAEAMAWLDRLVEEEVLEEVPSLAAVERLPRPVLPTLSPARQRAAELVASLLAVPEVEVRPKRPEPITLPKRLFHWLGQRWPMLALAVAMIVLVFSDLPLPIPMVQRDEYNRQAFAFIGEEVVEAEDGTRPVVLMAYDWDVQRAAEMRPLSLAVTRHVLNRDGRIIAVSTTFQGGQLAQEILDAAVLASEDEGLVYGRDYMNLGLRTGGESALRLLRTQPLYLTFPSDFQYGRRSSDYALMQEAQSLDDVSLLVIMAGEEDRVIAWLEQVRSQSLNKPCVLIVPMELEPLVQPYVQARGVAPDAVLTGLPTLAEYEAWLLQYEGIELNEEVPLGRRLNLLDVAMLGLVLIILLGNLAQLVRWLFGLRKGVSRS